MKELEKTKNVSAFSTLQKQIPTSSMPDCMNIIKQIDLEQVSHSNQQENLNQNIEQSFLGKRSLKDTHILT